jgi:putative polyketide hydroxylase
VELREGERVVHRWTFPCYLVGGPGLDYRGSFARKYGLESDGAVLVRPDGHVAWRSASGPATSTALSAALTRILAR